MTTNLAAAKIDGVEIEGVIHPAPWLRLDGHLTYIGARYSQWLEHSSCSAQYWRPQCSGLAGATTITIDHAAGLLDVAGQSVRFKPDRFANASKWQWSIQPSVLLKSWLGQDVTMGANIYRRDPYVDATAVANTSKLAGLEPLSQVTPFGTTTTDPYDAPGYTLVDLRADWRDVGGSRVSLAAGVTNLTNKIYRVSSASAFEIIGDAYSLVGEPRMVFVAAKYSY